MKKRHTTGDVSATLTPLTFFLLLTLVVSLVLLWTHAVFNEFYRAIVLVIGPLSFVYFILVGTRRASTTALMVLLIVTFIGLFVLGTGKPIPTLGVAPLNEMPSSPYPGAVFIVVSFIVNLSSFILILALFLIQMRRVLM